MTADKDVHSCGYHCILPQCIEAQRDELRERVAELHENGARLLEVANGAAAECIELRKRVAELEKDAARYRWLRAKKGLDLSAIRGGAVWIRPDGSMFIATHRLCAEDIAYGPAESLDETIDAAMDRPCPGTA